MIFTAGKLVRTMLFDVGECLGTPRQFKGLPVAPVLMSFVCGVERFAIEGDDFRWAVYLVLVLPMLFGLGTQVIEFVLDGFLKLGGQASGFRSPCSERRKTEVFGSSQQVSGVLRMARLQLFLG